MMHEDDYADTMCNVLRDFEPVSSLTEDDKTLLEDYAFRLFRGCKRENQPPIGQIMMKLVSLIHSYRINDKSKCLQRFVTPKHKKYAKQSDEYRIEKFRDKLQDLYEIMGGEYGTVAGNTLKDILIVAHNEPERFLESKKPIEELKYAADKTGIEQYLRFINTEKNITGIKTSDYIDEFIAKLATSL